MQTWKRGPAKARSPLRPSTALPNISHHSIFCTLKIPKNNTHTAPELQIYAKWQSSSFSFTAPSEAHPGWGLHIKMALDRSNPGIFLQPGHYLHMNRGSKAEYSHGRDPKAGWEHCRCSGEGHRAGTASPSATGLAGMGGQHKTWGSLSSTLKRPSLVNSIKGRNESRVGIKQDFCKSSLWSYCLIHHRHPNYVWF